MAHKEDSKTERIPATLDKKTFDKLKQYGDDLGIGPCRLASIGVYLIVEIIKNVEFETREEYNKPFKEVIAKFERWPYKFTLRPIKNAIDNPSIPKEVRDEIFSLLLEQISKQNKKNGGNGYENKI